MNPRKFILSEKVAATNQQEDFAVSGERLTSLHAKLHQEADRIRKWKNSTELDLKQKVTYILVTLLEEEEDLFIKTKMYTNDKAIMAHS